MDLDLREDSIDSDDLRDCISFLDIPGATTSLLQQIVLNESPKAAKLSGRLSNSSMDSFFRDHSEGLRSDTSRDDFSVQSETPSDTPSGSSRGRQKGLSTSLKALVRERNRIASSKFRKKQKVCRTH
jgi:hypothetical protein